MMQKRNCFVLFLFCLAVSQSTAFAANKKILGWVEHVRISQGIVIKAKLDTGAKTSSLYAENITYYKKDKKRWVKFTIPLNGQGEATLHKPLAGTMNIKLRKVGQELLGLKSVARPYIYLTICIGSQKEKIRVNLADRKNFVYPLLLGRQALKKFNATVNPHTKFTTDVAC